MLNNLTTGTNLQKYPIYNIGDNTATTFASVGPNYVDYNALINTYNNNGGYKPKQRVFTTAQINNLFYFKCDFDPILFREIDNFILSSVKYSERESDGFELEYRYAGDIITVVINNNSEKSESMFVFTFIEAFENNINYSTKKINDFSINFMKLANKPFSKCEKCLFMIDAKLEGFCNKTYKSIKIK